MNRRHFRKGLTIIIIGVLFNLYGYFFFDPGVFSNIPNPFTFMDAGILAVGGISVIMASLEPRD
jgi:hypothetical protein